MREDMGLCTGLGLSRLHGGPVLLNFGGADFVCNDVRVTCKAGGRLIFLDMKYPPIGVGSWDFGALIARLAFPFWHNP